MKEVYPGIFLITERGSLGVIKPPENVYLLAGSDGLIFDAGYGKKKTVKYLISQIKQIEDKYKADNKDFNVTRVLTSHAHPDHFSGSILLRKYLGLNIVMTSKTAEIVKDKKTYKKFFEPDRETMMSVGSFRRRIKDSIQTSLWRFFYYRTYGLKFIPDPDEIISDNSEILINDEPWKVFPSPGHSPDHISLYNEEKGVLFSGDNVLRSITTWLGPPHCDMEQYIESIEFIQKLPNLKLVLASHGSPVDYPQERLKEILVHRKERTQEVLELVNQNSIQGITPSGIVNALYPNQGLIMQNTARGWVCLTLQMLEDQNLIRRETGRKKIFFFPNKE